jgi:hypothetical protein
MVQTSPHVPYTPRAILKKCDDSSALLKIRKEKKKKRKKYI